MRATARAAPRVGASARWIASTSGTHSISILSTNVCAAVWAAWDQPALGALQAIEAAGRGDEGIVITGIDANPQAREAIAKGGNFEASMAQDFKGIGHGTADAVQRYLAGEKIKQSVIYVPTRLITSANVKE